MMDDEECVDRSIHLYRDPIQAECLFFVPRLVSSWYVTMNGTFSILERTLFVDLGGSTWQSDSSNPPHSVHYRNTHGNVMPADQDGCAQRSLCRCVSRESSRREAPDSKFMALRTAGLY